MHTIHIQHDFKSFIVGLLPTNKVINTVDNNMEFDMLLFKNNNYYFLLITDNNCNG